MRNRLWKRISAACLTAMVAVSMLGITAFADEEESTNTTVEVDTIETDDGTYINISKIVSTDGDTYEPNTTFEFVLTEYSDDEYSTEVSDGTSGVLTLSYGSRSSVETTSTGATGTITFEPGDVGSKSTYVYYEIYGYVSEENENSSASVSGGLYLVIDDSADAGTYYYTLTEEEGSYEGIRYDTTTYYLAVTITSTENENEETETSVTVVASKDSTDESAKVGSIVFDNDYGYTEDEGDPDGTTHDIEVFKEVEGNGADEGELFDFYVDVKETEANKGEWYKVVYRMTSTSEDVVTHVVAGGSILIQLSSTGSIQVYGLTETDEVTIYEADYSASGYETTISDVYLGNTAQTGTDTSEEGSGDTTTYYTTTNGTELTTSESTTTSIYGTLGDDGVSATITNTRNANVITGVVMTVAPYLVLLAAAVVLLALFITRRRRVEY